MDRKKIPFSMIPAGFWYGLIFYFSAQNAEISGGQSSGLIFKTLSILCPLFRNAEELVQVTSIEMLSFFIRKAAHMTLYLILCLLVFFALRQWKPWRWIVTPTLCFLLAALDEYHQTFVPGRSGEVRDTLVDLCGVLLGLLLIYLITAAKHRKPRWVAWVVLGSGLILMLLPPLFPDALRYPPFIWRYSCGDAQTLLESGIPPETVLPAVSLVLHQFCFVISQLYWLITVAYMLCFFPKYSKKDAVK